MKPTFLTEMTLITLFTLITVSNGRVLSTRSIVLLTSALGKRARLLGN